MKIDHIALYVEDLELVKAFYVRYFGATSNSMYHNPKTGLKTYFLSFGEEGAQTRLELMTRPDLAIATRDLKASGYIHLAFALADKAAVDTLTETLKDDGYTVVSGPRTTGDGYYESCVLDPEGNQIEITA